MAPLAGGGERARRLPREPLLAPGRPRAPDRRGARQGRARPRDEEHRRAPRPRAEPRRRAQRAGARQPLPPPQPAHAARGPPRARLRAAQRAPASREAAARRARQPAVTLDPASSACWFDGWRRDVASRFSRYNRGPCPRSPARAPGCCASGGDVTDSWTQPSYRRAPSCRVEARSSRSPVMRCQRGGSARERTIVGFCGTSRELWYACIARSGGSPPHSRIRAALATATSAASTASRATLCRACPRGWRMDPGGAGDPWLARGNRAV